MRWIFCLLLPLSCFASSVVYYSLDNVTPVSSDEIFNDPFLALRTKTTGPDSSYSIYSAWDNLNDFYCVEWEKEIPTLNPYIVTSDAEVKVTHCECPHPTFTLHVNAPAEKVYWQISSISDFSHLFPNLDQIEPFVSAVTVSPINQTFLNPGQTYFFRARVYSSQGWTEWSDPLIFSVEKPRQPTNVTCTETTLSWNADPSPEARYLVFGSDTSAFIPSIYSDVGISPIIETTDPSIAIDPSISYYRIITRVGDVYSVPSSLAVVEDWTSLLDQLEPAYSPAASGYKYNPLVEKSVWDQLTPYFLPDSHPAKKQLDAIFNAKKRVLESTESLKHAGFKHPKPRQWTRLIVTSHSKVPGMIIKLYTDQQHPHRGRPEYTFWVSRIQGASLIRQAIQERGLQGIFCVPQKWIYPVPQKPSPSSGIKYRKNFILVEDDMNIFSDPENEARWKSGHITAKKLDLVFGLLQDLGLWDCAKPANIPFCKDGKIAFIDTQTYHTWPVKLDRLTPFLSPPLQEHWKGLIQK